MRMRITLRSPEGGRAVVPVSYNHLVQAAIYNSLSESLSSFLHDRGFPYGKRRFKMFTFSRLLGRFALDRGAGRLVYEGDVTLYVSSPVERLVEELAGTILRRGYLVIGNRLDVVGVSFPPTPPIGSEVEVRTLSPVTVYSTLYTPDGRRKTYYYSPYEREFSKLASSNAKKKHYVLTGRSIKSDIEVEPLKVREVFVSYKGTIVRGWTGSFVLRGPKSLILTVYEAGLGAKNSQGFGMLEVVQRT